jgi:hypothetical protein
MNSGQQLFTIAGIFLVAVLVINVNSDNSERELSLYSSESVIDASGLAQSIIDIIQSKAFDENTIYKEVWVTDSLTLNKNLGPDAGEYNLNHFDDIDDFNSYNTMITLERMGDFIVSY